MCEDKEEEAVQKRDVTEKCMYRQMCSHVTVGMYGHVGEMSICKERLHQCMETRSCVQTE